MWQKIFALLSSKYPGVRKDALTNMAKSLEMAVSNEDDAKKLVDGLDKNKVDEFVKDFRSGIDREITEANKTFEEGLREKYDFKEKTGATDDPGKGGKGDDVKSMIASAVAEAMAPMTTMIQSLNAEKLTTTRRSQIEAILKDVPESYKSRMLKDFDRMSFADDASFNEYLTEAKTDVDSYVQEMADEGLSRTGQVSFGQANKDGISSGVAAYIESMKKGDSDLGGKEL